MTESPFHFAPAFSIFVCSSSCPLIENLDNKNRRGSRVRRSHSLSPLRSLNNLETAAPVRRFQETLLCAPFSRTLSTECQVERGT
jgi:hypothetical protein